MVETMNIEEAISDVACYLRKSRGDLDTDLLKHKSIMLEICEKNKWRYVLYEEIGSGATIEDRPKMQELMRDLEDDMYDAILILEMDRLSRGDEEDSGFIKKHLLKTETLVVECSPYRILNLYNENDMQTVDFKGFLARQEYLQITKRLTRGKKIGAKLGNWSNGLAPFPYEYNATKKGLVINKNKYEVYREMMNRLFKGESLSQIADYLNSINYPSPRSKYRKQSNAKWHGNSVGAILKSEVHLGRIISNKSKFNKYKKEKVNVPKSEWVIVENCHESCKTKEEHEKILSIIKANQKKATDYRNVNMYTSLVKCYQCESTLHIQKRKNGKYSVRKCKCGMQGGDCEFLIELIKSMLNEIGTNIDKMVNSLDRNNNKSSIENKINLNGKKLNELGEERQRIIDGYIGKLYSIEEANELKKPIENKIEHLKIELENLQKELSSTKSVNPKEMKNKIHTAIKNLKTTNETIINDTFRKIIDGVYWNRNKDDLEVYIELKWT